MPVPGNLLTTAMAVMPHTDADKALQTALSLDVPFWPQLPRLSYYEDMYVQAAEHFPGILLDTENRTLRFSRDKFARELEGTLERMDDPDFMDISPDYSTVYHSFLQLELSGRPGIRGQLEGPVSFGLNVQDEEGRPLLFDETVRPFLLEFMAARVNAQLHRLLRKNSQAFMFVDEPGLQFVFSAVSGYGDVAAKSDLEYFLTLIDRPRGIHLCGNPDWDFLLNLDLDVLSLDVYSNGERFAGYASSIRRFLERGGVLVWGQVPTNVEQFEGEDVESLQNRLQDLWRSLERKGVDREMLLRQSLLSPATCCLVNPDITGTVETAFSRVRDLSRRLRRDYGLSQTA
jgi:hypothetical protein